MSMGMTTQGVMSLVRGAVRNVRTYSVRGSSGVPMLCMCSGTIVTSDGRHGGQDDESAPALRDCQERRPRDDERLSRAGREAERPPDLRDGGRAPGQVAPRAGPRVRIPPAPDATPPGARCMMGEAKAAVGECEHAQSDAEPQEAAREQRALQCDQARALLDRRPSRAIRPDMTYTAEDIEQHRQFPPPQEEPSHEQPTEDSHEEDEHTADVARHGPPLSAAHENWIAVATKAFGSAMKT
jgi:hypothetical protein